MSLPDNFPVSMDAVVTSPKGKSFHSLRNASPEAIQAKGNLLDRAHTYLTEHEPELLWLLNNSSVEYAVSAAIRDSQQPEVQLALYQMSIETDLDQGHFHLALDKIIRAHKYHQIEFPQYNSEICLNDWYSQALNNGRPNDAWLLAMHVEEQPDNLFSGFNFPEWRNREIQAFLPYAQEIMDMLEQFPDEKTYQVMLGNIYQCCYDRGGGYHQQISPDFSSQIARKWVEVQLASGHGLSALESAIEAGLPDEEVKKLKWQISLPGIISNKLKQAVGSLFKQT